jgi:hypothetical protein
MSKGGDENVGKYRETLPLIGGDKVSDVKVPRQCPLVLLVKVG